MTKNKKENPTTSDKYDYKKRNVLMCFPNKCTVGFIKNKNKNGENEDIEKGE